MQVQQKGFYTACVCVCVCAAQWVRGRPLPLSPKTDLYLNIASSAATRPRLETPEPILTLQLLSFLPPPPPPSTSPHPTLTSWWSIDLIGISSMSRSIIKSRKRNRMSVWKLEMVNVGLFKINWNYYFEYIDELLITFLSMSISRELL